MTRMDSHHPSQTHLHHHVGQIERDLHDGPGRQRPSRKYPGSGRAAELRRMLVTAMERQRYRCAWCREASVTAPRKGVDKRHAGHLRIWRIGREEVGGFALCFSCAMRASHGSEPPGNMMLPRDLKAAQIFPGDGEWMAP